MIVSLEPTSVVGKGRWDRIFFKHFLLFILVLVVPFCYQSEKKEKVACKADAAALIRQQLDAERECQVEEARARAVCSIFFEFLPRWL